jgi:DNA-binding GntR family transcriptional regulator
LVRVNERHVAARLGCSRSTVARAIDEFEAEGKVMRFGRRDSRGLVLRLLWQEANPTLRGVPITINPVGTA